MANVSKFKVPNGTTYTIKDSTARSDASAAKTLATSAMNNIATIESSSTASKTYAEGDYLVYNKILYKVISGINSGETLTPSTNIEATTTGAELTALNKWKEAGTVTGKTALTLPSEFNELQVNITLTSNYQVSQHFTKAELNGGWYLWGAPYYTSNGLTPAVATAYISVTSYTLYSARYGSSDTTSTAVSRVYYR
jgi:hypothetical protein